MIRRAVPRKTQGLLWQPGFVEKRQQALQAWEDTQQAAAGPSSSIAGISSSSNSGRPGTSNSNRSVTDQLQAMRVSSSSNGEGISSSSRSEQAAAGGSGAATEGEKKSKVERVCGHCAKRGVDLKRCSACRQVSVKRHYISVCSGCTCVCFLLGIALALCDSSLLLCISIE